MAQDFQYEDHKTLNPELDAATPPHLRNSSFAKILHDVYEAVDSGKEGIVDRILKPVTAYMDEWDISEVTVAVTRELQDDAADYNSRMLAYLQYRGELSVEDEIAVKVREDDVNYHVWTSYTDSSGVEYIIDVYRGVVSALDDLPDELKGEYISTPDHPIDSYEPAYDLSDLLAIDIYRRIAEGQLGLRDTILAPALKAAHHGAVRLDINVNEQLLEQATLEEIHAVSTWMIVAGLLSELQAKGELSAADKINTSFTVSVDGNDFHTHRWVRYTSEEGEEWIIDPHNHLISPKDEMSLEQAELYAARDRNREVSAFIFEIAMKLL